MVGRISRREDFLRLRRSGRSARAGRIRVSVVEPRTEGPRRAAAFAVPRAVGGAVVRNRIRRRLRALVAARDAAGDLPEGWYLVSVGQGGTEPGFEQLGVWLGDALDRLAGSSGAHRG